MIFHPPSAWTARRLGFPCLILVPDHAPEAKVNALRRYGAEVRRITLDDWWRIMSTGVLPGYDGFFLHGVFDQRVMAGYGAIGLELLEQVPNLDAVVIPFGGGAMTCGIAAAPSSNENRQRIRLDAARRAKSVGSGLRSRDGRSMCSRLFASRQATARRCA